MAAMRGGVMLGLEIIDFADTLSDELKQPAKWTTVYIETSLPWPTKWQKINYLGEDYWVIPVTNDAYPGLATKTPNLGDISSQERLLRLLSVLSWVEGKGIIPVSFGGGGRLYAFLRPKGGIRTICDKLDLSYLPEVIDRKQRLAIALMREARGLQHVAFSFLSFYRVLEVAVGKAQVKAWVNDAVLRLAPGRAVEARDELLATGVADIADHIYVSGRCAIAHAGGDPIVDPDDPTDATRLYREKPLIEGLAELAVEEKLGLQTAMTVFRRHLYELSGFKRILGEERLKKILNEEDVEGGFIDAPIIDFQIADKGPIRTLMNLHPQRFEARERRVFVEYATEDKSLFVRFWLNFDTERLDFNLEDGIYGTPDDQSAAYAERKADILEFMKFYLMNGKLHITVARTGELISRKDSFIPVNFFVEPERFDEDIAAWRKEALDRAKM